MQLRGQQKHQDGYAMAALLVAMSVMAIAMTVAMPVWKQASQREKEAELIFRGEQYARAVGLFQKKAGPGTLPPNVEILVQQRFLRKKYKDPINGLDFSLVGPAVGTSAGAGGRGQAPPGASGASGTSGATGASGRSGFSIPSFGGTSATPQGGVAGVVSKSTEKSIRIYNGKTKYNEWVFQYVPQQQAPGAGGAGGPQRGGPQGIPTPPGIGGLPTNGRGGRGPFGGGGSGGGGRGLIGPDGRPLPLPFPPGGMPPQGPARPPGR